MKPTIVTLTPRENSSNTVRVATFEEAFGEFSEARGRGRERRAKRRADRQRKKRQRIADRQETRRLKRTTRIANRGERKKMRQDVRAQQQEARQLRKDTRKSRRVARKEMGEQEEPQEEQTQSQEQGGDDSQYQEQGGDNSQGGVVGEEQGGQSEEQGGQVEEQVQEQGGNGEGEAESTEEGQVEEADQEVSEEGGEEESGFDGEDELLGAEDTYNSELRGAEDYYLNVDGQMTKINPKVAEVSKRIEYNKYTLSRLEMRLTNVKTVEEREQVLNQIARRKARIKELEGMLEGYSSARGNSKHGANRRREIAKARKDARVKLRREKKEAKIEKRKAFRKDGGSETSVEKDLNPDISEQRIEVPASEEVSGFNGGTGLIGVDDNSDYDAPAVRKFDLKFSSADGGVAKPKTNWTAIAIGVGVGVLAIYLIKKYKVLEAK